MRTIILLIGLLAITHVLLAQDSPITVSDSGSQFPPLGKRKGADKEKLVSIDHASGFPPEDNHVFHFRETSGGTLLRATCMDVGKQKIPLTSLWKVEFVMGPTSIRITLGAPDMNNQGIDLVVIPRHDQPSQSNGAWHVDVPGATFDRIQLYQNGSAVGQPHLATAVKFHYCGPKGCDGACP